MPVFCIVYEYSDRSNGENTRSFENMLCIRDKNAGKKVACKPASAFWRSESDNACVCKWLI